VTLSPKHSLGRAYIATVIVVGLGVVSESLWRVLRQPPGVEWFLLAALTLLTGSFTVKLPSLPAKISVSETFVFTSVLLFGPSAGTVTVVLDALVISLWMRRASRPPIRVLFNATAPAIAIRAASEVFFSIAATAPGQINQDHIGSLIAPVFAFALLYFLINTALVAGALAFERGGSIFGLWWTHFPPVSITYFVGSSIAMLIVAYTDHIDITVLSIIVPLLVISYLTFRTSMGRLEDANRHVSQVHELYLSTIETLAMAVDAKDQITHGHIRRVQVYAVELAKRMGVTDPHQLKAIEAAALLHDMGKLAIPEHILNKPGKLTEAEFEKMKRHSDVGAALLSSIRFPYPVVPIVRHHHENWDGSGYPARLAGTDIPLGARILSVVDCFDALTSDRPYRPRLRPEEAFSILTNRRGTMYDPLVVDGFIATYSDIAEAAFTAGQQAKSLVSLLEDPSDQSSSTPLSDIRATAAQTSILAECQRELEHSRSAREVLTSAFQQIRLLTPATVCALYQYTSDNDTLLCNESCGDPEKLLCGLTARKGERISGWSAANERTIANSRAALELNAIAGFFSPPLLSAMAVPIRSRSRVIGVLAGFSCREHPFSEDHIYAFERIADFVGDRLHQLSDSASSAGVIRFPIVDSRKSL
jgi:putative nucleotidyltransferase with HDIG domain